MYPAPFDYVRAGSYQEAAQLLHDRGENAKLIAGGQSLVPMMNLRLARPELLIDINDVGRGAGPVLRDGWLHMPAVTRQRALERLPAVATHAPLFATAAAHTGNVRVRTRGTIGGNLAHADPSSELSCVAVATEAEVDVVGADGSRRIAATDLFITDLTTSLEQSEVIRSVEVPTRPARTGYGFAELARRAGEFAIVIAAAVVTLDELGSCQGVRLAFGGVGARIVDGSAMAAEHLVGVDPTPDRVVAAVAGTSGASSPRDDHQASAQYRSRLMAVLGSRALRDAIAGANGASGG
jgi:carbon-monoxide dehydrogenase medium subunit